MTFPIPALTRSQSVPHNLKLLPQDKPPAGEKPHTEPSQATPDMTAMLDIKRQQQVDPQTFAYSAEKPAAAVASEASPVAKPAAAYVRVDVDNTAQIENIAELALSLDVRNVAPELRDSGSYLTLPPTFGPATVRQLASLPSVVAVGDDGKTAGFMLASEPHADTPSPVLRGLQAVVQNSELRNMRWAIYGPVGVATTHQGQGMASKLFRSLLDEFARTDKQAIVGFVDLRNRPSLAFHEKKLGFEKFGEFEVNGQKYAAIQYLLPTQGSAAPEPAL